MSRSGIGPIILLLMIFVTADVSAYNEEHLVQLMRVEVPPGAASLDLGTSYLEPGSVKVLLDGRPLPPEHFRLDEVLGRLELFEEFPGGLLEVESRLMPFRLPRLQTRSALRSWRELQIPEQSAEASHPLARPDAGTRGASGELNMMGSKSLVLRLGSGEDLAVEQSLRLSLSGQVADSTFVEAVLRDDDLPFQPEGNTERLEELDKVVLRVVGPAGHAEMGDFVFETPRRELTPFERDFQGLAATWSGERGLSSLWLAQSRGVFTRSEFYGEEGLQGPYELLSALRRDGAVILAGSEKVFLNGSVLTRGRDQDYVIDYDQGSIIFGSGIVLSASDRIRVDYRYSLEAWRRTAWGGAAATRVGGLRLDFLHFDESDAADSPLAFPLDEERRGILEAAGDASDLAVTDGISETPGEGHYVWVDSLAPEAPGHFEWVDSLGDYQLRFRELGAGQGDYQAAGIASGGQRIYAWVGEGLGSFRLGEELTPPTAYRLESLRLDFERGGWIAEGEFALSDYDANTLSPLDDEDNQALALRASMKGDWDGPLGRRARLSLRGELLQSHFRFPGARRGSHDYRDWNLQERPRDLDEQLGALELGWGETRRGGFILGAEGLRFGSRFHGLRESVDAGMPIGGRLLGAKLRWLQSRDDQFGEGGSEEAFLRLDGPGGWLPDLGASAKSVRRELGDSLDLLRAPEQRTSYRHEQGEIRFHGGGLASWELAWGEEAIEADGDRDRVRRFRGGLEGMSLFGGRGSLSGHYRRREGFLDKEQFQAEGRMIWAPVSAGWHGQGLYRLGSRQQRLRESRLVYVGFGSGDLNEEGVHVGEGEGEYRLLSLPAEESAVTRNLEMETGLIREPTLAGGPLARLGSETRFSLVEENREAGIGELLALRPAVFRKKGATLFGELNLQQEFRMLLAEAWRLRYRVQFLDRLDERFTGGAREDRQIRHELRARRVVSAGEWSLKIQDENLRRADEAASGAGSYRVHAWGGETEGNLNFGDRWGAAFRSGLRWQRDAERELSVSNLILEPRLSLSPIKLIRLDISWELTRSRYSEGDPTQGRPWFFDAEGWKRILRIEGSAQAGSHLSFNALFELREEEDRERRQRLRLESRAFF